MIERTHKFLTSEDGTTAAFFLDLLALLEINTEMLGSVPVHNVPPASQHLYYPKLSTSCEVRRACKSVSPSVRQSVYRLTAVLTQEALPSQCPSVTSDIFCAFFAALDTAWFLPDQAWPLPASSIVDRQDVLLQCGRLVSDLRPSLIRS